MSRPVITRFAPSPTGLFHVGSARTALYNYLFSKQQGGAFFLRIEDTDKERSKPEFEDNIRDSLDWLGISHTGPLYRQSERGDIYETYILKLLKSNAAYISDEEKDGKPSQVIRFRNTGETIEFEDIIRGNIKIDTTDLGDFVIARSTREPLYHLAVVIDDYESGVTHIIRGEDHISNTPRQILLIRAIGGIVPQYAHMPMILGADKSKLSKRHGATSVTSYKALGYLPHALINYLALLGWHPSESEQEIFTLEELLEQFKLENLQKAGAVFDSEKLNWINKQHIGLLSTDEFLHYALDWLPQSFKDSSDWSEEVFSRMIPMIKERISVFNEIREMGLSGELSYFFSQPEFLIDSLLWKDDTREQAIEHLTKASTMIADMPELSSEEDYKKCLWEYAENQGKGSVLWPLRYALSGRDRSPNPFEIISIIGTAKTLERIDNALIMLRS